MTVMDIDRPVLTPEQARLAHGLRHTTAVNLRDAQGECTYRMVALHYDMVEMAISCLGIDDSLKEAFRTAAGLPSELVAEVLK